MEDVAAEENDCLYTRGVAGGALACPREVGTTVSRATITAPGSFILM
jgi:hypothetical protein